MTTHTMAIYSNDHLHLSRDLHVQHLIVHLGRPGPTMNPGSYMFTYDRIELIGEGEFRIMRNHIFSRSIVQKIIPCDASQVLSIIVVPEPSDIE